MRISEIINEDIPLPQFDTENYGQWTVQMSKSPVLMPKYTGNTKQYVAKITNKKKESFIAAGSSQADARDKALKQAIGDDRSDDINNYKSIVANLNADFSKEYLNDNSTNWYKFVKDGNGLFLVRANKNYVNEFGSEIRDLGFSLVQPRTYPGKGYEPPTRYLTMPVSKKVINDLGIPFNMRYTLEYAQDDADGNEMFVMHPVSRVQVKHQKEFIGSPGITISGSNSIVEGFDYV